MKKLSTEDTFVKEYNNEIEALELKGKHEAEALDIIAKSAIKILKIEKGLDSFSSVEKAELIELADTKYLSNNGKPASPTFQQLLDLAPKQLVEEDQEEFISKKQLYLKLLTLIAQIMLLASILLLIGLFITNPIMAMAIVNVVVVFAINLWTTLALPFIMQNAFDIGVLLSIMTLTLIITHAIDYKARKNAGKQEHSKKVSSAIQKHKEAMHRKYTKKATMQDKKTIEIKLSKFRKRQDNEYRQPEIDKLEKDLLFKNLKENENELFLLNKNPTHSKDQKVEIQTLETKIQETKDQLSNKANESYISQIQEIKDQLSNKANESYISQKSQGMGHRIDKDQKNLAIRPWYKRVFSPEVERTMILTNLAESCKLLDRTTEGTREPILSASETAVCNMLKKGYSAKELYDAGFSMRDIKFATTNKEHLREDDKTFIEEGPESLAKPNNLVDDYVREIASLKSQLLSLKKELNTLEVSEQNVTEALELDIEEKALLSSEKGVAEQKEIDLHNAYQIYKEKKELLRFKATKSSNKQLKERDKIKAQISSLHLRLEKIIDDLSSNAEQKSNLEDAKKNYYIIKPQEFGESFSSLEEFLNNACFTISKPLYINESLDISTTFQSIKKLSDENKKLVIDRLAEASKIEYTKLKDLIDNEDSMIEDVSNRNMILTSITQIDDYECIRKIEAAYKKHNATIKAIKADEKTGSALPKIIITLDKTGVGEFENIISDRALEQKSSLVTDLNDPNVYLEDTFVRALAGSYLKGQDVATMVISYNQLEYNSNDLFDTQKSLDEQIISKTNPISGANTVAFIIHKNQHYTALILNKKGEIWTAYAVDSMGNKSTDNANSIVSKFKKDLGIESDISILCNTYNHQKNLECGIHSIENISAVAKALEDNEEITTNEQLTEVVKKNANLRYDLAEDKVATRREMLFVEAYDKDPILRHMLNIFPGKILMKKDEEDKIAILSKRLSEVKECSNRKEDEIAILFKRLRKLEIYTNSYASKIQKIFRKYMQNRRSSNSATHTLVSNNENINIKHKVLNTGLFKAVKDAIDKNKGNKKQTYEGITNLLESLKNSEEDENIFTTYISSATKQKESLNKRLINLENLKDAAKHSLSNNKINILTSITNDIKSAEEAIKEITISIDVLNSVQKGYSKKNRTIETGIIQVYTTLDSYTESSTAVSKVEETVSLANYQPQEASRTKNFDEVRNSAARSIISNNQAVEPTTSRYFKKGNVQVSIDKTSISSKLSESQLENLNEIMKKKNIK